MKKAVAITFILIIFLCGCSTESTISSAQSENTVSVILPNKETAETVNGYYIPPADDASTKYYANINTKKFHIESCRWAKSTKKENLLITSDRSRLLKEGYAPCKNCEP